jgi:Uma2 family endonuclease
MTYPEYLAAESVSDVRHEYLNGEVWVMARIEVHRRTEAGRWELLEARPGESIELASLGVRLDVSAIYENPLAAG